VVALKPPTGGWPLQRARMSDSSSDLFELKNFFVLGNYQAAINEGNSIAASHLKESEKVERDVYIYRSYIAQGKYQIVLGEIKESAPTPLQAVRLLASYLLKEDNREISLVTLKEWMNDGVSANNPTLQLIAGQIYYNEGNYEEAMRCVYQANTLEGLALLIQIYLKINRIDQAEKEFRAMQQMDDDASITQLTSAWISILSGGEKIQEAFLIFQELTEKYGATSLLLNGMAVCSMHLKRYSDAERYLLQALEKNSTDADTLANLIACYQQSGKAPEMIARQMNQLKSVAPKHAWMSTTVQAEESFDRLAKSFAIA